MTTLVRVAFFLDVDNQAPLEHDRIEAKLSPSPESCPEIERINPA